MQASTVPYASIHTCFLMSYVMLPSCVMLSHTLASTFHSFMHTSSDAHTHMQAPTLAQGRMACLPMQGWGAMRSMQQEWEAMQVEWEASHHHLAWEGLV